MEIWKLRTHFRGKKDESRVVLLKNGQYITTVPRELTRWKRIGKGSLLKWSDAGENRVLVEVVKAD